MPFPAPLRRSQRPHGTTFSCQAPPAASLRGLIRGRRGRTAGAAGAGEKPSYDRPAPSWRCARERPGRPSQAGPLDPAVWTNAALETLAAQWGGTQNTTQETALQTALIDTEVDALTGGSGRDWFFVRGAGESDPPDFDPLDDRKAT